jgi:hypothetical protein
VSDFLAIAGLGTALAYQPAGAVRGPSNAGRTSPADWPYNMTYVVGSWNHVTACSKPESTPYTALTRVGVWWKSGRKMVVIGLAAAAIGFGMDDSSTQTAASISRTAAGQQLERRGRFRALPTRLSSAGQPTKRRVDEHLPEGHSYRFVAQVVSSTLKPSTRPAPPLLGVCHPSFADLAAA